MSAAQNFQIVFNADELVEKPVYEHFQGQSQPQPAFISIDENGKVDADYSGEIGNGVPSKVWHNRTLRVPINPELSAGEIENFLHDDATTRLLARIVDGHDVEWDGSNHVGSLTDDARDALESLGRLAEGLVTETPVMSADEWLFGGGQHLLDHWADCSLENAVDELMKYVDEYAHVPDAKAEIPQVLLDKALSYLQNERDGLTQFHFDALIAAKMVDQDEVDEYLEGQTQND